MRSRDLEGERILAVVPAYNEEATVAEVVRDLAARASYARVLVVDDGSTDRTAEAAAEAGAEVLRMPFNLGIGGAVQAGFKYALERGYRIAVQVDADGQHDAVWVRRIVAPIVAGRADSVVGARLYGPSDASSTRARRLATLVLSRIVSLLVRQRFTDVTSGFRALGPRALAFAARNYPADYPEPESLVLMHRAGFTVAEVPIRMRARQGGRSSIRLFGAAYYVLKVLVAVTLEATKKVPKESRP
jgi:glycosyltransferase involved in cell wall biosynthesis